MQLHTRLYEWNEKRPVILITVSFIVTRIIFKIAGVKFYGEFVKRLWQSIDVEILKTDLLQSLFYSHAQPPLFNLLSGIVLKIFPGHYSFVFHLLFLLIGWLTCVLLYLVIRKLNISVGWSLVITFYFMICPAVVLYENLYSYTYVTVCLLTLSGYLLLRFSQKQNVTSWVLLWCALSTLVLLRSYFHFFWLVILFGILFTFIHNKKLPVRKFLITGVIPILLVFAWLLKNWVVFGTFASSSWLGMNLARIMPVQTEIGKVGPFKPISYYKNISHSGQYADIKMLHQEYKSKTGYINFYHIDYIELSKAFIRDFFSEVEKHPQQYFKRVAGACKIYFSPAAQAPFVDYNYRHISDYARILNVDFTGYVKFKADRFSTAQALPVFVLHFILFVGLIYCFRKQLFNQSEMLVMTVMTFLLMYSLVVSNFLEYGENNRFRFEHLTIFLILFAKTFDVIGTRFLSKKIVPKTKLYSSRVI